MITGGRKLARYPAQKWLNEGRDVMSQKWTPIIAVKRNRYNSFDEIEPLPGSPSIVTSKIFSMLYAMSLLKEPARANVE